MNDKDRVTHLSAHTTNSNSPETDAMPRVWHTVNGVGPDGSDMTIQIYATDPMDAITTARRRPFSMWRKA